MTSLAEQLKQLAAPQTSLLVHTKKKSSFLFDPKQAADLDTDTLYELGVSGLAELKSINPVFGIFETSLFDEESRNFERAVGTQQANTKLDQQINKFLFLLSPYFPLRSAHKALEWLIRRYHIHEYNIDAIMGLILPYHETNLFARMVQILTLNKETDRWFWLKSIQKKSVPLSKTLLLSRASSDNAFFKFVCNLPLQATQVHGSKSDCLSTLFAFYCTTVIGVFEQTPQVSELQVTHLLPSIMTGISSSYIDFIASVYMILAHLSTKTHLTSRLLEELFYKIIKNIQPKLHMESGMLLIALCQNFDGKSIVTMQSVLQLSSLPWLIPTVSSLADSGVVVYPLISSIMSTSAKVMKRSALALSSQEALTSIVSDILNNIHFDAAEAEGLFSLLLSNEIIEGEKTMFWRKWHHSILRELEKKYPKTFDKIMAAKPELIHFMPNYTPQNELFERLNHSSPDVRAKTVKHIIENLDVSKESWLKESLGDMLNDESPIVLDTLLKMPHTIIKTLLPMEELINRFTNIISKAWQNKDGFSILAPVAFQQLCSLNPNSTLFLLVAFPFLLPKTKNEFATAKIILGSKFADEIEFLKILKRQRFKHKQQLLEAVQQLLKSQCSLPKMNELLLVLKQFGSMNSIYLFTAAILASASLLTEVTPQKVQSVMELLHQYMVSPKLKFVKNEGEISIDSVLSLVSYCKEDILPLQGALFLLTSIITKTEIFPESFTFWEITNSRVAVYVDIFKVILFGINSPKRKIQNAYGPCKDLFFQNFFPNIQSQTAFLANILLNSSDLAVDCLNIIHELIEKYSEEDITWAVETSTNNVIVPMLLYSLSSQDTRTRHSALKLLSVLMQKLAAPKRPGYLKLLNELENSKEEISVDNEQVGLLLYTLLSPDSAVKSLHNKSLRNYMSEALNELINIVTTPNIPIHISALILKMLVQISSPSILEALIPLGNQMMAVKHKQLTQEEACVLSSIIQHINNTTAQCFQDINNIVFWQFAKLCLDDHTTQIIVDSNKECPAILFLNQISRELFAELNTPVQEHLINIIVGAIAETENGDVSSAAASFMKRIVLDTTIVVPLLNQMKDITIKESTPVKARRIFRTRQSPPLQLLTTDEWKQGVCLLELIQNKKKLQNVQLLLPLLFDILNKCLEFEEQAPVEYTKQLLLSSILHCCQKLSPDGSPVDIPESMIQVELIVQCIRASQNPQTHHHALLVLTHIATMIPEQVLHNIMAIFTFMGSSVLRQDDAYSFQIISKIVETIIPVLIQRVKEGDELTGAVAGVLRVFVTALLDIPDHRRLPLLTKLLNTLSQGHFLWVFLCLVFESNVLHPSPNTSTAKEAASKRLEMSLQLCFQFSPLVLLPTCHQLIKYISCLPTDKDDKRSKELKGTSLLTLFDIERNTNKQLHHYMYSLLTFLSSLLSSVHFVSKIASLSETETNSLEEIFKVLVESVLNYIQQLSKMVDKSVNLPAGKYWRVMLNQSFDVLDKINALLPSDMFLSVIGSLVCHPLPTLCRKALDLLNWRLQQPRPLAADSLLLLLPQLLNIITSISTKQSQDVQLTQQTALISTKLIARHLAGDNPTAFKEILVKVTELVESSNAAEPVLASLVLCLGELCCTMRAHAISALPKFMPPLIKLLHKDELTDNADITLLSVVSAAHKIVESMPHFLSPYLNPFILELVVLSAQCQKYPDNQKIQPIAQRLKSILQKLSTETPLRVLLPAVSSCYSQLISQEQYSGVAPLMSLLADSFSSGNDLTPEMSQFLITALDFRMQSTKLDQVKLVETSVISTTIALILKLSESSFRPFYFKIYEWAIRSEDCKERAITFYRLTSSIAECLKGLFVQFVNYFIINAAKLLDENNLSKNKETSFGSDADEEAKACELVDAILKTLHTVFLYDANHFINKERFDTVMPPVVDQLENTLGGNIVSKMRCETLITPCLSQMAVSAGDDALWKQLNYQILLKTRHNLPQVRLAGLLSACEVAKKLGEEFLPLLPETVPFLAELLEDENEEVEKTCHHVVQDLETVLGEPIHKYF